MSWRRKEETVVFKVNAAYGPGANVSGVIYYSDVQTINIPNPRAGVVPVVHIDMLSDAGAISWASIPYGGVTDTVIRVRAVRAGGPPSTTGAVFHITLRYE